MYSDGMRWCVVCFNLYISRSYCYAPETVKHALDSLGSMPEQVLDNLECMGINDANTQYNAFASPFSYYLRFMFSTTTVSTRSDGQINMQTCVDLEYASVWSRAYSKWANEYYTKRL